MDTRRFDSLARALATSGTRRGLLTLLAALPLWPELSQPSVAFAKNKKKGKKKKATLCLDGQTLTVAKSKKKLRKLRQRGATPGACPGTPPPPPPPPPPVCTPSCPGTTCGGDDGCGGACGCPAGSLCHGGICQACDIACPPERAGCGADLQVLLASGGTVVACPGRYIGIFEPGDGAILIGSGDGDDPSTSTILDANGDAGPVMHIVPGRTVALQSIRIQGGATSGSGGGVLNQGALALEECTVTGNEARTGGGIRNSGALELTGCTVSGNEATSSVGGISSTGASLTLTRCHVASNKSAGGIGGILVGNSGTTTLVRTVVSQNEAINTPGGIFVESGTTLRVTDRSHITGNRAGGVGGGIFTWGIVEFDASSSITKNTAGTAFGAIYTTSATVALNGATVCGNTPTPQCNGIAGCPDSAECDA